MSEATRSDDDTGSGRLVRLFSVLSHDLKSPLFSIDGFADLLISDYSDRLDEEGRDFLKRIRSSAGQMRNVLEGMSGLVKLITRKPAPRPVAVAELLDELRLRFGSSLEREGVSLEIDPDLPSMHADPEHLREALGALLANAIDFADPEKASRTIQVRGVTASDGLSGFEIVDNGIGIDPKFATQVFQLGMKMDKARGQGPGYGLYLAQVIAELHGGRVELDSEPGAGSRFRFLLPAG